jgi:Leucine-rich repeat (LRR) protein
MAVGQRTGKIDPFQLYGPYGAETFTNYTQAQLKPNQVYRLKLIDQDLSKSLKRLKRLSKLYVVEFKNNTIDSFPDEITTFKNLMYLKSSANPIKKLPEDIGNTPTLKSLILHHVSLDSLPQSFNKINSLTELEIQINSADTLKIGNSLSGIFNLKSVILYKCQLDTFPLGLDKNTKLKKVLAVDCNLKHLTPSIGKNESIQILILDKNRFTTFPEELITNKSIKELSLRDNKITHIPEKVARMRSLEILDLTGNSIPDRELEVLKILLPGCKIIH